MDHAKLYCYKVYALHMRLVGDLALTPTGYYYFQNPGNQDATGNQPTGAWSMMWFDNGRVQLSVQNADIDSPPC
jgi:hypothetical protein